MYNVHFAAFCRLQLSQFGIETRRGGNYNQKIQMKAQDQNQEHSYQRKEPPLHMVNAKDGSQEA